MWIVNVSLIFLAIAFCGWLLFNYHHQLSTVLGILWAGCQSIIIAFGMILIEAVKAAIIAAPVGGAVGLIFFLAKAPETITKAVALSVACLIFALLVIKAIWENLHNLTWSIRHEVRNRDRR
ncbi:MAG: hypothetical protein WA828_06425 [Coleofasciculaceae cyanobacterium]